MKLLVVLWLLKSHGIHQVQSYSEKASLGSPTTSSFIEADLRSKMAFGAQ